MDQLKEFMGLFRRQHFWFILPVLLCMSAYGWWTAAGKVSGEVQQNVGKIDSMHNQADAIKTVSAPDAPELGHPNTEWHTVMEELIASRQQNVLLAWQKKWDRQGEILKWPADAFGPRSADVIPVVEQLRPIEKQDFTVNANKLPSVARSDYKDFMKNQLPVIASKIGAIWDPQGSFIDATTGAKRAITDPTEEVPIGYDKPIIVKWNPDSQKAIEDAK